MQELPKEFCKARVERDVTNTCCAVPHHYSYCCTNILTSSCIMDRFDLKNILVHHLSRNNISNVRISSSDVAFYDMNCKIGIFPLAI